MSSSEHPCVFWPPAKTSFMADIRQPQAQAIIKDTHKGCVFGMSYRIQGERIYAGNKPRTIYFIHIDGWEYTIRDDSIEYPILSFSYLEAGPHGFQGEKVINNIQVMSRPVTRGYRLPDKTLRTAAYLMQRIAAGIVPDASRVLSLYKLMPVHPTMPGFFQDSFYSALRGSKDPD